MATTRNRRSTLVDYLAEATTEERKIEAELASHLVVTTAPSYQRRLERHLEATKRRAADLEKRLARLGGDPRRDVGSPGPGARRQVKQAARDVAGRAVELAEGPVEAVAGDGEAPRLLGNARSEYARSAALIGTYRVVRALARAAEDKETAKLAKRCRVEHEELAEYVRKLVPKLARAVVKHEAATPPASAGRATVAAKRRPSAPKSRATAAAAPAKRGAAKARTAGARRRAPAAKSS